MKKNSIGKLSDCQLIEKLKQGDVTAYEALFTRYYLHIRNFIRSLVKNGGIAEDIAQNVFMKLWLSRNDINQNLPLKSWLFILARNEVLNFFKRMKPIMLDDASSADKKAINENSTQDEFSEYPGLESSLLNKISEMPEQRQKIFLMSRYRAMSNKEIAENLNLSVRTVEKHISLALKELRNYFN